MAHFRGVHSLWSDISVPIGGGHSAIHKKVADKTFASGNLASNPSDMQRWKPWEVAREIYNATKLGPALPPFARIVRTTVPK